MRLPGDLVVGELILHRLVVLHRLVNRDEVGAIENLHNDFFLERHGAISSLENLDGACRRKNNDAVDIGRRNVTRG